MEEETKEIKDLNELETPTIIPIDDTKKDEEESLIAEEINSTEKNKDSKSNKKLYIVLGIIGALILILLIILIVILGHKKPEEVETVPKESQFVTTMKKSIKEDSLSQEINKGLEKLNIKTNTVKLLYIDIDSDSNKEVVAYAEEGSTKGIIQLEIADDIIFDDAFPMDSIDSLGYVYDSIQSKNFWYTLKDKNYTLISSAKKIIKEEDFLDSYFIITQKYKEKAILQNAISYEFGKNLDIEKLEKISFTNEELLTDNKLKIEDIKDLYNNYLKEKKEKEDKEKKELEEKEKAEKERQRLEGRLQLGNISYHYGTYSILLENGESDGTMILYSDRTCVHKGINCTYTIETMTPSDDEMIPIISLSTGHVYKPGPIEGDLTDLESKVTVKYTP